MPSSAQCDGIITVNPDSSIECSTGFVITDPAVFESLNSITIEQADDLLGAVLLLWGLAYGFNFIKKFLLSQYFGKF